MIDRLLDAARSLGGADALWRREERTSIAFESGRLKTAAVTEEAGVNVRVVAGGRMGVAGTTAATPDLAALLDRARASADLGEALDLAFPPTSRLPHVPTFFDRAANASLDQLIGMGRGLVERLAREGCQVNVAIEREVGETAVGNTAAAPPEGALPVVFTPAGLAAVILPLEQALSGKTVLQGSSPLAARVGAEVFDARLSITDDPLAADGPASRPLDDECVPSAATLLVERGIVRGFVYDLETATRAQVRSTGHGRRGIFGKPQIRYTNLIVGSGPDRVGAQHAAPLHAPLQLAGGLVSDIQDGLIVDDLIGVGQGNVIGGGFSHPVGLAYRVQRGEITGRVKDAAVAGNVYDLQKRIAGLGNDGRWLGSRWSPSLRLDGVSVARR